MYVVGVIPPVGGTNRAELLEIAGRRENVFLTLDGFEGLDERFAAQIARELCPLPCTA